MDKCCISDCDNEATGEYVIGGIHFLYCSKHFYEAVSMVNKEND